MAKILVQVQDSAGVDSWSKINTYTYEQVPSKPAYFEKARKEAIESMRTWSTYHSFVNCSMRLLHISYQINSKGYREETSEVLLTTIRSGSNG